MTADKESYTITMRAMPGDDRPAITRLRYLLKIARRALRLQCVAINETAGPVQVAGHDLEDK